MSPSQIAGRVKNEDWSLVGRGGSIPAAAVPTLLPLLGDENPQVRELTVRCLSLAGGADATGGLLQALSDPADTVRATAARMLRRHIAGLDLEKVQNAIGTSYDEYVREQLTLLLGESGDPAQIPFLRKRVGYERDEHARAATFAALARLGDEGHRSGLIARLEQEGPPRAKMDALENLVYTGDRSLLPHTMVCLNDLRPAVMVRSSENPLVFRVCDLAVNAINRMLGGPFPFADGRRQYSEAELSAVKTAIQLLSAGDRGKR